MRYPTILNFVILLLAMKVNSIENKNVVSTILQIVKSERCACVHVVDLKAHNNNSVIVKLLANKAMTSLTSFPDYFEQLKTNSCVQPLFVVLSSLNISLLNLRNNMSKAVWFIINDTEQKIEEFFNDVNVAFDSKVIVAKATSGNNLQLNLIYRVHLNHSLIINKYEFGNRDAIFRTDMEGFQLKVAVTVRESLSHNIDQKMSMMYVICLWDALKYSLNFTSLEVAYLGNIGTYENKSWTGLIKETLNGAYDVMLTGFNITPERLNVLDIAQTILRGRYYIFFKLNSYTVGYAAPFRPFHPYVWGAIIAWVIAGSVVMYLISMFSKSTTYNIDRRWKETGLTKYFYFLLQTLSIQGSTETPRSNALRIIFLTAYLVSTVLLPSYSASLISHLTRRTPTYPFTTLKGILDTNYRVWINMQNADYLFFDLSNDSVVQRLKEEKFISYVPEQEEENTRISMPLFRGLCEHSNYATIVTVTDLPKNFDSSNVEGIKGCKILKVDENLGVIHMSVAFQKGSPFLKAINRRILQLRQYGFFNFAFRRFLKTHSENVHSYVEITIADVAIIYFLYFWGIILSIFLLIYEQLTFKATKAPPTSKIYHTRRAKMINKGVQTLFYL